MRPSHDADRAGWDAQRAGRADLRDLHWHYRDVLLTLEGAPMTDETTPEIVTTMDDADEVVDLDGPAEVAAQSTIAEYDHDTIKEEQG